MCVFEVAGDKAFEALLSCCVPELQSDDFSTGGDVFTDKVNADSGLTHTSFTFLVGSN